MDTSQAGLDTCSIIGLKAGGEEDSLRGAFEKEMSLWTIYVDGGPPPKKKRAIGKGELPDVTPPFIVDSAVSMNDFKSFR